MKLDNKKIIKICNEKNISIVMLSIKAKKSISWAQKICYGLTTNITLDSLGKLMYALQLSLDDLKDIIKE